MEKPREIPMENLLGKTQSVYKLVILAAKRALELSEGFPKLVEGGAKEKPAITALREIAEGKVTLRAKKKAKG